MQQFSAVLFCRSCSHVLPKTRFSYIPPRIYNSPVSMENPKVAGFRVLAILRLHWDNGKENGNHYLGFRVWNGLDLERRAVWGSGFKDLPQK